MKLEHRFTLIISHKGGLQRYKTFNKKIPTRPQRN